MVKGVWWVRADKLLANRGIGSRKDVRKLIMRNKVRVQDYDGVFHDVQGPKSKVPERSTILIGDKVYPQLPTLVAYYKPVDIHSVMKDPLGRTTIADKLPTQYKDLHPVGRLDADSEGLLLFSRSGTLTNQLLDPNRKIPRCYIAHVEGNPNEDELRTQLNDGIETSFGIQNASLISVNNGNEVCLEVTEGKNRMVRRILNNAGFPVTRLIRIKYGNLGIEEMKEGEFKEVSLEDEKILYKTLRESSKLKIKKRKGNHPNRKREPLNEEGDVPPEE